MKTDLMELLVRAQIRETTLPPLSMNEAIHNLELVTTSSEAGCTKHTFRTQYYDEALEKDKLLFADITVSKLRTTQKF